MYILKMYFVIEILFESILYNTVKEGLYFFINTTYTYKIIPCTCMNPVLLLFHLWKQNLQVQVELLVQLYNDFFN